MPAAMVHGSGGGVLLMMTTKLASQKTIKKTQNYKQTQSKPTPSQPYQIQNKQHKITSKQDHRNKHPAPSNKLTD